MKRRVRGYRDHIYFIILAVITDTEGNVACTIVQYKSCIIVRWLDKILKILKPEKEQFFINPSILEQEKIAQTGQPFQNCGGIGNLG
jgi:hypothetical protein